MPQLVIIAGPNGSGKSTLTEKGQLAAHGLSFPEHYINADNIAARLRQQGWSGTQEELERAAFQQARDLRREYREQGVSFAFETVFSHPSTLLDMQKCRNGGYEVMLIYVTTAQAEINVARVAGRIRQGGHAVPEEKIRERYDRSMTLLPRAVEEANRVLVFDTTQEQQPRLCFQKLPYQAPLNPPAYLQTRLILPLRARRTERTSLASQFTDLELPDEERGILKGPFRIILRDYAIQESGQRFYSA